MTDLEMAKEKLIADKLTICIVKNGEVIYTSVEKGIYPIYNAAELMNEDLGGASIADRVIGKAAAMICKSVSVKSLYTEIITEEALSILEAINVVYSKKVPFIKNRDKSDLCPIEKISRTTDNTDELIKKIEEFLKGIERI